MEPNLRRKVDFLYSMPTAKTTMTKKEIEAVIDEVGTEIIAAGRLRTITFKKIIGSRYNVSTIPYSE